MTFSQYGDYFYLYILLLTMIPAIILGLREKSIKYYGMIATIFMIFLIVGVNVSLKFLIAFTVMEVAVIKGYEYVRKKTDSKLIYRLFLLASMSPIIINKISPLTSFGAIGFIGISYLNFRAIQMVIEIYDG
ncbi:D-alanyl-lipoteichoic acid biosynthesis protein DltB, partial [Clostridium tertium]